MVSILPSERSGADLIFKSLGQGLQNSLPTLQKNAELQRGLSAIDQLQNSLNPQNGQTIDQSKVLADMARVQALLPGFERSAYGEHVMKLAGAKAAQDVPLPNAKQKINPDEYQVPQRGEEVNFLNKPSVNRFAPTNKGPAGNIGNAPQQATAGVKKPIPSPEENAQRAPAYAKELTNRGIPTTPIEAYKLLNDISEDNARYNEKIDLETQKRVLSQEKYGQKGLEALKDLYPNPSRELKTVVKGWAEEASKMGEAGEGSEAEIERFINNKVKNLSDATTNAKKTLSVPRVFDKIERGMDGSYRDFESSAKDVRNHLRPLLDLGLYEEARGVLQELGYGPEEREMVINPLSEREQVALNSLPMAAKGTSNFRKISGRIEPTIENMKNALVDLKNVSPNFSPLLSRKYAEDRGYDWNLFKDAWNELVEEDRAQVEQYEMQRKQNPEMPPFPDNKRLFKLNDDQERQSGRLNTPPLNMLDKFLHSLDLIGR